MNHRLYLTALICLTSLNSAWLRAAETDPNADRAAVPTVPPGFEVKFFAKEPLVRQNRRQRRPMVTAAVVVDLRRAAHFAANDQKDSVLKPPVADVVQERRNGPVQRRAEALQAALLIGVELAAVEVPAAILDHHQPGPGLAQSPSEQHLPTQQRRASRKIGKIHEVRTRQRDVAGVVPLDESRIFAVEAKGFGDAAAQDPIRLGGEPIVGREYPIVDDG